MKYPIERNGYIYSKGTKEGFLRMQRQGIARPLFSLQDKLAKVIKKRYDLLIKKLIRELKGKLSDENITLDNAPEDNIEELLAYFEEQGEKLRAENKKLTDRIALQQTARELENEWFKENQEEAESLDNVYQGDVDVNFRPVLDKIFHKEQNYYLKRLMSDAGTKMKGILKMFAIDKNQFFENNLANVRELYLDNSIQRIHGEEEWLKRQILQRIVDYATGKTSSLHLIDLVKAGYEGSNYLSRLFARDQMQRFNKACTLSTFKNAKVTKVKWVTCGDVRVRDSHRALNGKIFDINNLPEEVDDYNCRCGLVPVEWKE